MHTFLESIYFMCSRWNIRRRANIRCCIFCLEHVSHSRNYSCFLIRPLYTHTIRYGLFFWFDMRCEWGTDIRFGHADRRKMFKGITKKDVHSIVLCDFFFHWTHVPLCSSRAHNLIEKVYNLSRLRTMTKRNRPFAHTHFHSYHRSVENFVRRSTSSGELL